MKKKKIKFNRVLIFLIFASLILSGFGCSTTRAIRSRYHANRRGDYDFIGEVKEITHAIGKDAVGVFHLIGRGITFFGRGLERTGRLLQRKPR